MGSFSLLLLFFPNFLNFNFFYLFIAWKWWKIGLRKWYSFNAGHGFPKNLQQRLQYVLNSWDTFAFLGRFPIHSGPTPPLTPQTVLHACIQNFFRVSTLYSVGGRENCKKILKSMHCFKREPRNDRKI